MQHTITEDLRAAALWLRSVLEQHPDMDTLALTGPKGSVTYSHGEGLTVDVAGETLSYPEAALDDEKWALAHG